MARERTRSSTMLSLLAGAGLLLASVRAACYDTWGNEDSNQVPCFAPETTDTTTTTWCCNKGDYCLSNGLCLSPDYNNLMMQQGCTDENWGGGCQKFCTPPSQQDLETNAVPLIPCPASFGNPIDNIRFCCGPDASSCCETPSSWIAIPTGRIIGDPTALAAGSSAAPTSSPLRLALGIGLGIGLPIFLALLTVAYLLIRPLSGRPRGHYHVRRHGGSSNHGINGGGGGGDDDGDDEKRGPNRRHTAGSRNRRDSFGRVDTNIGPPSDDGHWDPMSAAAASAAWPPNGAGNVAAAIAAWARAGAGPFNTNDISTAAAGAEYAAGIGMVPPPSPKEMDGRCRSRSRSRAGFGGRETPVKVAELPVDGADGVGVRVKVMEVAEEVELPVYLPDSDVDVERGGVRGEKM
ncbi:hypothetical protein MFIFM68171_08296 [Madurella fahalii]|uniref:Uncharacterized protein n=1 Tax=Madurella fahalii TaxID=1157608 RepID=A0ABQ0GK17_9PEZI